MKLFFVRLLLLTGIILFAGTGRVVDSAIATFALYLIACIFVIAFGQTMVDEELEKANKNKEEGDK